MPLSFISEGGLGHLLRLNREYPSFGAVVVRAVHHSVPEKRTLLDKDLESTLSQLIQLVCTYSLQSTSTRRLVQLASILPSQCTPLPSLALLIHLTIKTNVPDYADTNLIPLLKRNLDFDSLRHILPPSTLKSHISSLLASPTLAPLAISIAHHWKDHINYDDEPDDLESTQEFLERIERQYLTETEGVKWRFEEVLEEWIGEWPDGREIGSTKIPRVRRCMPVEEENEEDDSEEFGGSLMKRFVPRSGLILETPLQSRGLDRMSERKGVLARLFRFSSIGKSVKTARVKKVGVDETDVESFLERLSQLQPEFQGKQMTGDMGRRCDRTGDTRYVGKRGIVSDDEINIYANSPIEIRRTHDIKPRRRKRRFEDTENKSAGSIYQDSDPESYHVRSPSASDVDELSVSLNHPRPALKGISTNRKSNPRVPNTMLVRECSPIFFDDASDDELAI